MSKLYQIKQRKLIIDHFWSKVDKISSSHGCWLWTGAKGGHGYGNFSAGGRTVRAHRFSKALEVGKLPCGYDLCHNCPGGDNKLCVKPNHLRLKTRKDHMEETAEKRQFATGDRSGRRLHPEVYAYMRGSTHPNTLHPENMPNGEDHWTKFKHHSMLGYGENNGYAKLTEKQVKKIFGLWKNGWTQASLARWFDVTETAIYSIVYGRSWKYLRLTCV